MLTTRYKKSLPTKETINGVEIIRVLRSGNDKQGGASANLMVQSDFDGARVRLRQFSHADRGSRPFEPGHQPQEALSSVVDRFASQSIISKYTNLYNELLAQPDIPR